MAAIGDKGPAAGRPNAGIGPGHIQHAREPKECPSPAIEGIDSLD